MAISLRGSTTPPGDGTGTIGSIPKPTGTAATDILIVTASYDKFRTLTAPAGWTQIPITAITTTNLAANAWWALGSVAATTFTYGSGGAWGWVCEAWTGVDNTTPIDVAGTPNAVTGVANITSNGITIATANAFWLVALGSWNSSCTFTRSGGTAGWVFDNNGATANQPCSTAYNGPMGTGATGNQQFNGSASGTGQQLTAIPFALRPAAASFVGEDEIEVVGSPVLWW